MDFLSLRGLVNLQPWRLELCRGGELYEYVAALVGLLRVAVHRGVFFLDSKELNAQNWNNCDLQYFVICVLSCKKTLGLLE